MVLKRRISYTWRIFVPVTIVLWALVLGLAWWQIRRESNFRREFVISQLNLVNSRIVAALEDGRSKDTFDFLRFVDRFYEENELFSDIRVTIYNKNWDVVRSVGVPILLSDDDRRKAEEQMIERTPREGTLSQADYFYMGTSTPNKQHYVISALPNDDELRNYLAGDRAKVWLVVIAIALALTIINFFSSRYITRNVRLLRQFAKRMDSDPGFIPGGDFPHDEFGDVARQIVAVYNERSKARRRLDHEHKIAMRAIEEKAVQKRQLTNNINHELKTPIGVIKGYLDTLVETEDLDPEMTRHFITKARDHANRLADLIADVSAITRLEDGGNMINTEALDYHDLVYSFANDINESGALGKMEFTFDIPMGTYVKGNTNLLTGMLMNLARNAANYSGGTFCRLVLNTDNDDPSVYSFSFYDDGSGVPDDALPHLFNRFYRIDSGRARKSGGTGLGLAIVYNTVTAHKGTIEGLNRPGNGLELRFTLPRAKRP